MTAEQAPVAEARMDHAVASLTNEAQKETSWATSAGSQPSSLASSHPDASPVFCHHMGMVCASNCRPDACLEAPDGKRRPQATPSASECDSLTVSDALRSSARKSADEGQKDRAVASHAEEVADDEDDYCPKCGESGMLVSCGDPDCGLCWRDDDSSAEAIVDDYLCDYTLESDDGSYTPTEREMLIVKDAIMGLVALPELIASIEPAILVEPSPQEQAPVAEAPEPFPVLCRAWGETDLPAVYIARSKAEIEQFIVNEWLGSRETTDYDGENSLERVMRQFDEHDWTVEACGAELLSWEFEIGGVSIERVDVADVAALRSSARKSAEEGRAVADPDRDAAIRIWHKHCDQFKTACGDNPPPSPVIDAMLEFAALSVQPKEA